MAAIIVLGSLNMDIAALGPRLPQPGETLMDRVLQRAGRQGCQSGICRCQAWRRRFHRHAGPGG